MLIMSCGGGTCGPNIEIGAYDLKEESFEYFPYQADDKLVFEDQDGKEINFTVRTFKELKPTQTIVEVLCSENIFDNQSEVFVTQEQYVIFESDNHQDDYIRVEMRTSVTNEEDMKDKVIYDRISFGGSIKTSWSAKIDFDFPTAFHQNGRKLSEAKHYRSFAKPIMDTIINSVIYQDVFVQENWDGTTILYNKKDGLFLLNKKGGNYLKLKK